MSDEMNFQTELSTAMSLENKKPLLEKIQGQAHYKKRISDENQAWDYINKSKICFCSEYYPYIGQKESEQSFIASKIDKPDPGWVDYWFLFYSGQFLHLIVTPEIFKESELRTKKRPGLNNQAPGFIEVIPLLELFGFIFLFVCKLCQANLYDTTLDIEIKLEKIKDFVLIDNGKYVAKRETIQWNENIQPKGFSNKYALDFACKTACHFLSLFGYQAPIDKFEKRLQTLLIHNS
jgi:hypothetical protein